MNLKQYLRKYFVTQFQLPNSILTFWFLLLTLVNVLVFFQSLSATSGVRIVTNNNLVYNQSSIWVVVSIAYLFNSIIAMFSSTYNSRFNLLFVMTNGLLLTVLTYLSWLTFVNI